VFLGRVQSLVAKRVRTCVRRRRVSHIRGSGEHRAFGAPMNENCTLWTLRVAWLKAFSLLRFFVAKDQEMTCRHAQWLTVIKRKSDSCRPLALKATPRHQPRPPTLEPGSPASTPTANPGTDQHPRPPTLEPGSPASTPTANPGTDQHPRPPPSPPIPASQAELTKTVVLSPFRPAQ